jgi:hypothetical protein
LRRIQWAGPWCNSRHHCTEEQIRKGHPEAKLARLESQCPKPRLIETRLEDSCCRPSPI